MITGKCDFCGFTIKLPKERFRRFNGSTFVDSDTAFCYHRVNGKYCLGNAVRRSKICATIIGNTIKVRAGHYVDLLNPNPSSLEIESIASALSKVCRYGGHCRLFYSVAEHCVMCSKLAIEDGHSLDFIKALFLHDASEAYLGDIVKPLKVSLKDYQKIEENFEGVICQAFGIDLKKHHDQIKKYDLELLKIEKESLFDDLDEEWAILKDIKSRELQLNYWAPHQAEYEFLRMWDEICYTYKNGCEKPEGIGKN